MADWSFRRGLFLTLLAGAAGTVGALGLSMLIVGGEASAAGVPATRIGINVTSPAYYIDSRPFTNLAIYGVLKYQVGKQTDSTITPDRVGPSGWPKDVQGDTRVRELMLTPADAKAGTAMRCTWKGSGQLTPEGAVKVTDNRPGEVDFVMTLPGRIAATAAGQKPALLGLTMTDITPDNPMTDVDCREQSRPRDQIFETAFLKSLAPYRVARFMDWMNVNNKTDVDFRNETMPVKPRALNNMIPLATMMALVQQTKVDPWFSMPYDGNDDYVRRYAQMVHDRLPPDRTVYVELGNEAWHPGGYTGRRAQADGLATGLTKAPWEANVLQYAVRSKQILDIWTKVFADRPKSLVRVVSSDAASPAVSDKMLGFRGTAASVDALAISPYFGHKIKPADGPGGAMDNDQVFERVEGTLDEVLGWARQQKVVANKYGKRLITYEAGQHLVPNWSGARSSEINHDPRMGAAYSKYLDNWASEIGDVMMMYTQTGPGFGLEDYEGQPPATAPKKRAVLEFIAKHPPYSK